MVVRGIQIVKELSVNWALFYANHLGNPTLYLGSVGVLRWLILDILHSESRLFCKYSYLLGRSEKKPAGCGLRFEENVRGL